MTSNGFAFPGEEINYKNNVKYLLVWAGLTPADLHFHISD